MKKLKVKLICNGKRKSLLQRSSDGAEPKKQEAAIARGILLEGQSTRGGGM